MKMKDLVIQGDSKTPAVELIAKKGHLSFSGKSIPENTISFFQPIFDWIDEYVKNPNDQTIFVIKLEYFNTSSSKALIEIFRKFEKVFKSGKEVLIQWYYEQDDEDMQESGEDFRDLLKVPVELIVY